MFMREGEFLSLQFKGQFDIDSFHFRLYVCGTNAHNPIDRILYANLTGLARHDRVPGIGNGIAKCPFDPEDNSTAVWVEHGNPGLV